MFKVGSNLTVHAVEEAIQEQNKHHGERDSSDTQHQTRGILQQIATGKEH
jgi:hypothetical protein